MADDDASFPAECLHQPDQVTGQVEQRVRMDVLGRIGLAVPALVGGDGVVAGGGQGVQLMPVGVPRLRKTVTEQDEGTLPRLGNVHADSVRVNEPV